MNGINRELVALRIGRTTAYISWKLLPQETRETGFNLYKVSGHGIPLKLTASPLKDCTEYLDDQVDFSGNTFYFVRAVIAGREEKPCKWYPLLGKVRAEKITELYMENKTSFPG